MRGNKQNVYASQAYSASLKTKISHQMQMLSVCEIIPWIQPVFIRIRPKKVLAPYHDSCIAINNYIGVQLFVKGGIDLHMNNVH